LFAFSYSFSGNPLQLILAVYTRCTQEDRLVHWTRGVAWSAAACH